MVVYSTQVVGVGGTLAWIAAIISAVGGLAVGAAQKSAADKANKGAGVNLTQAYGKAKRGMQPYGNVGTQGLYSLAELMGIEGYRTPEEQAYTRFLKTRPGAPGTSSWKDKADSSTKWITGHPGYQEDKKSGLYGLSVGLSGLGGITDVAFRGASKKKKKAEAEAAAENARRQKQYQAKLAAWEAKRGELETVAKESMARYDPSAALRRTPGYQFRYGEGERAVQANQAARNNTLGGRALKELTQYGQGFASNEYQNEFSRRLSLANIGQQAETTLGNISIGAGTGLANLNLAQGQANADFYSTANNALQSGLGNYLTYQQRQNQQPAASPYGSSFGNSTTPVSEDWAARMNQQYLS